MGFGSVGLGNLSCDEIQDSCKDSDLAAGLNTAKFAEIQSYCVGFDHPAGGCMVKSAEAGVLVYFCHILGLDDYKGILEGEVSSLAGCHSCGQYKVVDLASLAE